MKSFILRRLLLLLVVVSAIPSFAFGKDSIDGPLEEACRSVVKIRAFDKKGNEISRGTGFFINSGGSLVASSDVLATASKVEITLQDVGVFEATEKNFVVRDRDTNLTLLELRLDNAPYSWPRERPEELHRNSPLIVVGFKDGKSLSLTKGKIKAIRLIEGVNYRTFLLDIPIPAGLGGSPIFTPEGDLVGVVCELEEGGQRLSFGIEAWALAGLIDSVNQAPGEFQAARWGEDFSATYISAVLNYYGDDREAARQQISRLIERNPRYSSAYELLGSIHGDSGSYSKELEAYDQAIKAFPDESSFFFLRGTALESLGKNKEAMAAYRMALELEPLDSGALWNLAFLLVLEGDYAEAKKVSSKLSEVNQRYSVQLNQLIAKLDKQAPK